MTNDEMPKGTRDHARYDLAGFVEHCLDAKGGDAEADPYSFATTVIATVLEFALDDGIRGSMNLEEYNTLETLAKVLVGLDPHITFGPSSS